MPEKVKENDKYVWVDKVSATFILFIGGRMDLSRYDIIVDIDKSGSMGTKDCNGRSRWEAAQEATVAIARKAVEFDTDGITVAFFAGNFVEYNNVDGEQKVVDIFNGNEPMGGTNTARVLEHQIAGYFARKAAGEAKPIIILVVTDGEPDSREDVARVIVDATHRMDVDEEIGIQFIQVGSDAGAQSFLKWLDDELVDRKGAKFDIVDTKTMDELEGMRIADVMVAAISD